MKTTLATSSTDDLLLLAGALAHAAKGMRLHPRVARALLDITKTRQEIVAARETDHADASAVSPPGSPNTRDAYREARKRLKALADLLRVLGESPMAEEAAAAQRLFARAFPRGTTYLKSSIGSVVGQAVTIAALAGDESARKDLRTIHAEPMVDHAARSVKKLSAAFTQAACIAEEEAVDVASALEVNRRLTQVIRAYARLVDAAASLDPRIPRAELLAPLAHHKGRRRGKPADLEPRDGADEAGQDEARSDEAPPSKAA